MVYPHIEIILSNKKGTNDTGNNMDEFQNNLLSEISLAKMTTSHTIPFVWNPRKCFRGTKQFSGCGEQKWKERWIAKGHEETFGDDGNAYYLDCDNGLTGVYTCQNFMRKILCLKYAQFIIFQLYLKRL